MSISFALAIIKYRELGGEDMYKKILTGLLVVVMTVVSGCNTKEKATDPKTNQEEVDKTSKDQTTDGSQPVADKDDTEEKSATETKKEEAKTDENQDPKKIKAPDFKLQGLDGKEYTLDQFKGKYIFMNFWATWCKYCKQEMPDIQEVFQEYEVEKDQVVFLAIDVGESKDVVEKYINDGGYTFKVLLDTEQNVAAQYGIRSFPTTIFIDKEGYALGGIKGAITKEDMVKYITYMLSQGKETQEKATEEEKKDE